MPFADRDDDEDDHQDSLGQRGHLEILISGKEKQSTKAYLVHVNSHKDVIDLSSKSQLGVQ